MTILVFVNIHFRCVQFQIGVWRRVELVVSALEIRRISSAVRTMVDASLVVCHDDYEAKHGGNICEKRSDLGIGMYRTIISSNNNCM